MWIHWKLDLPLTKGSREEKNAMKLVCVVGWVMPSLGF